MHAQLKSKHAGKSKEHNAECTYSRIQEPEFSLSLELCFIYSFFVTLLLMLYLEKTVLL